MKIESKSVVILQLAALLRYDLMSICLKMRDYCYKTLFFGLYSHNCAFEELVSATAHLIEGRFDNDIFR